MSPYSGTNCSLLCQNRRTFDRNKIGGLIFLEVKAKMLQNEGKILRMYDRQVLTLKNLRQR